MIAPSYWVLRNPPALQLTQMAEEVKTKAPPSIGGIFSTATGRNAVIAGISIALGGLVGPDRKRVFILAGVTFQSKLQGYR